MNGFQVVCRVRCGTAWHSAYKCVPLACLHTLEVKKMKGSLNLESWEYLRCFLCTVFTLVEVP
jgi:hypothetical protein